MGISGACGKATPGVVIEDDSACIERLGFSLQFTVGRRVSGVGFRRNYRLTVSLGGTLPLMTPKREKSGSMVYLGSCKIVSSTIG